MLLQSLLSYFKRSSGTRLKIPVPNTLSGYFELRIDRIVGSVRDKFGSHAASMQIEILHHGAVIASFAASPHRAFGRFEFSHSVDGRFTGAELVKEDVVVMARDSDGNSGRILLDGAAQIELAREHLGIPSVVAFDLDFSRGGNSKSYLGTGWYGAAPDHTFTEGDDSFVRFETPTEPGTYILRMTAGAFINKPELSAQELIVFVNETQVAYIFCTAGHPQFQECKFSHDAFGRAAQTTLRFHHPNAARPADFKLSSDTRRLAFSFKRLTLVRLLRPE